MAAVANPVPGHIGYIDIYKQHPWLQGVDDFIPDSRTQKVGAVFKRLIRLPSEFTGSISNGISCLRHLEKILPVLGALSGSPQLFSLYLVTRLSPSVSYSDGHEPFNDLNYWVNGGMLKDLAKRRVVNIVAMACLVPANIITAANFLKSVALINFNYSGLIFNSYTGSSIRIGTVFASSEMYDKVATYAYSAFFALATVQSYMNMVRYEDKAEFYSDIDIVNNFRLYARSLNSQVTDDIIREHAEGKNLTNTRKVDAAKRDMWANAAKLACVVGMYIVGIQNIYAVAAINTAALVTTAYRKY